MRSAHPPAWSGPAFSLVSFGRGLALHLGSQSAVTCTRPADEGGKEKGNDDDDKVSSSSHRVEDEAQAEKPEVEVVDGQDEVAVVSEKE